jgi:hypothetical protein
VVALGGEAEVPDVVDHRPDTHLLQQPDRHEVARMHQRVAQARRPAKPPPEFFGRHTSSSAGSSMMIGASRITIAGVKLPASAAAYMNGLKPDRAGAGHGRAVELALAFEVVEAADQRQIGAVVRIERDQRAFASGPARARRALCLLVHHVHDVAAREDLAALLGRVRASVR